MAGSAVIGALRVDLSIDTAAFSNGLKGASGQLSAFGAGLRKSMVAVGLAVAAAAAGLAVAFKGAANEAERLGAMAQQIGIPVDELSRLKHAAELSEVSLDSLATGVRKLSKQMADISRGAGKDASVAFNALGVSATNADGSLRSSSEVIGDLADRFSKMEDGAAKTALAIAIFGRSGAQLIPMLNAGRAGLQAMKDEADKLGIVIDQKTAAAADRFNDNLTRLARVKDGIIMRMTQGMLPAFERLSKLLVDSAMNTDIFQRIGERLGRMMEGVARAIMFVSDNLQIFVRIAVVFIGMRLAQTVVTMGVAFVKLAGVIRTVGLASMALTTVLRAKQRMILLVAAALALGIGQSEAFAAKMRELGAAVESMLPAGVSQKMATWFGALGFNVDALTRDLEGLDTSVGGAAGTLGSLDDALSNSAAGMEAVKEATRMAAQELDSMNSAAENVFMQTRTDAELAAMEIQNLNGMFQAGAISFDTYNRALAQVNDGLLSVGEIGRDVGEMIQSQVGGAIDSFVEGTFRLKDAVESALKSLTKLLLNSAFQRIAGSFATGSPGGGVFANLLSGLAGGGGSPGFAKGGRFKVGGAGGIDSKLVQFRATPGEMVDIRKPGADNGAAGQVEVHVHTTEPAVVSKERRHTSSGERLDITIDTLVASQLATPGSNSNRTLRQQGGGTPLTRR